MMKYLHYSSWKWHERRAFFHPFLQTNLPGKKGSSLISSCWRFTNLFLINNQVIILVMKAVIFFFLMNYFSCNIFYFLALNRQMLLKLWSDIMAICFIKIYNIYIYLMVISFASCPLFFYLSYGLGEVDDFWWVDFRVLLLASECC